MFLVISKWKPKPGMEEEFERRGVAVREAMRSQPGTEFLHGFFSDGVLHAVHGYTDEATYEKIVNDPNGPFAKAVAEHKMEDVADWLGSVRGKTLD